MSSEAIFRTVMLRTATICLACSASAAVAQEAQPAARVGDTTAGGGAVVTGDSSVLINGRPAAREGDLTTNPSIQGTVPGVGGVIRGSGQAGASDRIVTGSSNVFIGPNVFIGGQRAATVAPPSQPVVEPKSGSRVSDASARSVREMSHFLGKQIAKFIAFLRKAQNTGKHLDDR